ncbi:MAG: chemotaxis protein CheW [Gemmatimonadaceae bacterium]
MTAAERANGEGVDWAEVRRRVDELRRALAGEATITEARARQILAERARELAATSAPAQSPGDAIETIAFTLAGQRYAIESRFVVEVFHLSELARLPGGERGGGSGPAVGLTGWRGRLLTILDLRQVLGLPTGALDDLARVIVLGAERPVYGLLADRVDELVAVPVAELHAPHESVRVNRKFVRGVTGDALLVLDAEALLTVGEDTPRGRETL